MPNADHLKILEQGVDAWNAWRVKEPLVRPDLTHAPLDRMDLSAANFSGADLSGASLSRAQLRGAKFSGADLGGADLSGAFSMAHTDLSEANLREANLSGAHLSRSYLINADLTQANLSGANLNRMSLYGANLSEANLSGAHLSWANLSRATLVETDLTNADLTNCIIYGISAWGLKLSESTKQQDLVITPPGEPRITVDNIEVAQFVYLLLHNEKIRDVIDTIGKKAVLILGRFTPERKAVLDALREELRKRDYLPILFDFEKPASQDLTATVSTLAHLARFIIADLTDPSSIPYELASVVPTTPVPIQPILLSGNAEFAMFVDLRRRYGWVLPTQHYDDLMQLIADLGERVIRPAEAKVTQLRETTVAPPLNPRTTP